jgi:hypothetical protein
MTTRYNAQALMDEVQKEHPSLSGYTLAVFAVQRAIERHEAFRQEVSDVVSKAIKHIKDGRPAFAAGAIGVFVIPKPKPKPDPLVEVLHEVDTGPEWDSPEDYCNKIRAALDALGFEIREKNDD